MATFRVVVDGVGEDFWVEAEDLDCTLNYVRFTNQHGKVTVAVFPREKVAGVVKKDAITSA